MEVVMNKKVKEIEEKEIKKKTKTTDKEAKKKTKIAVKEVKKKAKTTTKEKAKKAVSENKADYEETILTKEGYEKLKEELEYLKNDSRDEIAERIKAAISFGDLSENSEYEDAKREQSYLEGKIAELEKRLLHVKIIESEIDTKKVTLGSKVKLINVEGGEEYIFTIVGSMEFDPENLKISNVSPIGKAILDKKVGTTVKVKLPAGFIQYKIAEIMQ